MLKGKGRSELWELYLHGDKTIKMDRVSSEVLPRGAMTKFAQTTTTTLELMTSTKRTLGASACSMIGSAAMTKFAQTTTTTSSSS